LDELVQEVFVEAYYSLPKYRGSGPLEAWLGRIATRVGYRFCRRRRKQMPTLGDERLWSAIGRVDPAALDPGEAAELVHALLERLGPRDRLALVLLYVEGHSLEEAARLAGWSKTMLKVQAFRARQRLRAVLAAAQIDTIDEALEKLPAAAGSLSREQR
jgi:RNA polymerase sigma-70 factor (ECF subfamily)